MHIDEAIRKALEGDTGCYGAVVRKYQGRLRAFVASFCPDADRVDEVAQRTFVWAYEHLKEYEPGTRFWAWLKAVGRNMLLSELEMQKRETRMRRKYLDHFQVTRARQELLSGAHREQPEMAEALRRCVDELAEHSRKLIRRRYETEESIRDISRDLGKKENAVKTALFRIRQALRRCVEGKLGTQAGLSSA
jgi:RNA polymerase sigma-70 factor (ECF subfamily)